MRQTSQLFLKFKQFLSLLWASSFGILRGCLLLLLLFPINLKATVWIDRIFQLCAFEQCASHCRVCKVGKVKSVFHIPVRRRPSLSYHFPGTTRIESLLFIVQVSVPCAIKKSWC